MREIGPQDHAEVVALLRAEVIGSLSRRELSRGELQQELKTLSRQRFRLPGAKSTRTFSVPTLERWYYAYKKGGLEALKPKPRSDRGRARALSEELRDLILDIRREHPNASAALIQRTLVADGRLEPDAVSPVTLRRLFGEHGLDRLSLRGGHGGKTRLRWQAQSPDALWHGDVCYGPGLLIDGLRRSLRIHALLDDASRFIVAIEALHTECESDMLALFGDALRRRGLPDALYLDNGSTYRGESLRVACERLGTTLLHANPYDPQARGKMERFWRTLREGCLDYVGSLGSLHEVNLRLWAFLDQHYHKAPHASLMGSSPERVYAPSSRPVVPVDEDQLRAAFTARESRRVRRDSTLDVAGVTFELDQGFLAGRIVTVAHCMLDRPLQPWVEYQQKRYALRPVDPKANAHRKRRQLPDQDAPTVPFDPPQALLDKAMRRNRPARRRKDLP
jgi:putative transposase